jgi:hypothetical protein
MTTEAISLSESKRLVALEQTIEQGRKTFVEVGIALAEIRDSRLYRSDFKTFEDYCREKWGWNRQHCNQLISGAAAVNSLPVGMDTIVSNQGQARELAKVEPAKRVEVITQAAATAKAEARPMTAKDIVAASPSPHAPYRAPEFFIVWTPLEVWNGGDYPSRTGLEPL